MPDTFIFPFLFNAAWLSALFTISAWAAIKLFAIENASARTVIWSAAFFLTAFTPFVSFAPGGIDRITINSVPAAINAATPAAPTEALNDGAPAGAVMAEPWNRTTLLDAMAAALILIWFAGAVWRGARLAHDALAIARLRWESAPLRERADGVLLPPHVSLRSHPTINVPIASGLFRAAIILPEANARQLKSPVAQAALAHELAHLNRGDLFFSFAEALVLCLFWWNPLMWKLRTKITETREMACDDSAVTLMQDPSAYAQSLVEFAERAMASREGNTHHAALAATGNPSDLKRRITRLMADDYRERARLSMTRALLAGAAMTAVTVGAAAAAPRIVVAAVTPTSHLVQPEATSDAESLGRALVDAIANRQWATADALIASGADINAVLYGDGTPLIAAVNAGSADYVEKLVSMGADVEATATYDETALISAVRQRNATIVSLLITAGADVNKSVTTENGVLRSPLGEAKRLGLRDIETMLRDAGAE